MKYNAYKDWHHWIMAVIVVLGTAYGAAYKYLNPADFQPQNALYYDILAVAFLLVYGHKIAQMHAQVKIVESTLVGRLKAVENRLGMGDTHSMPAMNPPQAINLPPRRDDLVQ